MSKVLNEKQLFIKVMKEIINYSFKMYTTKESLVYMMQPDIHKLKDMYYVLIETRDRNNIKEKELKFLNSVLSNIEEIYMVSGNEKLVKQLTLSLLDTVQTQEDMISFIVAVESFIIYIEDHCMVEGDDNANKSYGLINSILKNYNLMMFIYKSSPKNRLIKNIIIEESMTKFTIEYSGNKLVTNDDYSKYVQHKSVAKTMSEVVVRIADDVFECYAELGDMFISGWLNYKLHNNKAPDQISKFNKKFPLVECTVRDEVAMNININFKDDVDMQDVYNKRKYALPKSGCIIKFLSDDVNIEECFVNKIDDCYNFKCKVKGNGILNTSSRPVRELKLYMDEQDIRSMVDSFLGLEYSKDSMTIRDYHIKNNDIRIDEKTDRLTHEVNVNLFMLCCLYLIHCDINNPNVQLRNYKDESNLIKSSHTISYRTAYIRRLPVGSNASDEAKNRAKELGIILDEGYTFVREFNNSNNIRTIRVR